MTERPEVPPGFDPIDAHELGGDGADLCGGLDDEPIDLDAGEEPDAQGRVVDLQPGRLQRERLNAALDPRLIERMKDDEEREDDEDDRSPDARGQAAGPSREATARRRFAGTQGTERAHGGSF